MEADKKKIKNRLNRIKGQVEGIIKMVDDDKYCLDVSAQIMAVNSALNSTNKIILSNHIRSCLKESLEKKDEKEIEEKIEEIEKIILKLGK